MTWPARRRAHAVTLGAGPRVVATVHSFARIWASAISGTSYVPMSGAELVDLIHELAGELTSALLADPFTVEPAWQAGFKLVEAHFTDPETVERSVAVIGERLLDEIGLVRSDRLTSKVTRLKGALAAGYAQALRDRTLREQEAIRAAVLGARDEAESALRTSEAKFRAMFSDAAIGIGISDLSGRVLDANDSLLRMTGLTREQALASNVVSYIHPEDAESGRWDSYDRVCRGQLDHYRVEKRLCRPDGTWVWTNVTASLVRDERGKPLYVMAMMEDVTERHALQCKLHRLATHDSLTELPNRLLFLHRLDRVFTADESRRVGLCYLDLDGFKVVNDSLGHDIGDQLLVAVAARLAGTVAGPKRLVARMGGDEFVVLAEDISDIEDMIVIAEAVQEALRPPVRIGSHELSVSASIGIVQRLVAGTTPADLMRDADITQYWAKSDGRGRWAVYDPERNATEVARFTLSAAMPAAMERDEFYLDYQPLVRLQDERILGAEALVRWQHPEFGRLAPDRFIELAEETGLIVPLGRWILRTACAQAKCWLERFGVDAPFVSVNLAVRQCREPNLINEVRTILDQTGLPPAKLQLELTESAIMGTADQPLDTLNALAELGVRIAIDDFGTGYSNLAYLRHLPVRELKIAGSFVEGLQSDESADPVDAEIIATLVSLAHTLGLTVTAEGVETRALAKRLRGIGCDAGQGWLFARPGPPADIEKLLSVSSLSRK